MPIAHAGHAKASPVDTSARLAGEVARLKREGVADLLSSLGAAASDRQVLMDELAECFGLPIVRMQDLLSWQPCFDCIGFAEIVQRRCAMFDAGDQRQLVIVDPFDADLLAWSMTCHGPTPTYLASDETFDAWLAHAESGMNALHHLGTGVAPGDQRSPDVHLLAAESLSLRVIGADESPAVRFVNSTLYDALKVGASDIHLEVDPGGLNVKFRLDGVLTLMQRLDNVEFALQSISRIKVMAQLDIAERRIPQDGRMQISRSGRTIDVRVSIMPSIHGEDAVLRILDRAHLAQSLAGLTLASLGFDEATQTQVRALCGKPHGMLLVTGPTGSGKTTTLYAAISETHLSRDKIITIEDPVEYQLPGVLQIPVNERKGLTFARGLRSILRHDPDKILVGEIRDAETAQIAMQSALTGHLVFTTVHANTVFDVVGRFEQFGIDAYTFASAINGVMAQRLVRRVCAHCSCPAEHASHPSEATSTGAVLSWEGLRMAGQGCEHCRGTGYAGRFALAEILRLTSNSKELIAQRAPVSEIQKEAALTGWRSLRDQALEAAAAGMTTLEEVDRVAG